MSSIKMVEEFESKVKDLENEIKEKELEKVFWKLFNYNLFLIINKG